MSIQEILYRSGDYAAANGAEYQLRGGVKTQFVHNSSPMGFDGVKAEAEDGGDFLITVAFREELIDVTLPFGEEFKTVIGRVRGVRSGADSMLNKSVNFRTEEPFATADGGDGCNELLLDAVLEGVAAGTFSKRPQDVAFIGMHTEHEYFAVWEKPA